MKEDKMKNMKEHDAHDYSGHNGEEHNSSNHEEHHDHHAMMVEDFRRRFFISLIITVPILVLSPMIQMFMGVDLRFTGDSYLLFLLSSVLYIYGAIPVMKKSEL